MNLIFKFLENDFNQANGLGFASKINLTSITNTWLNPLILGLCNSWSLPMMKIGEMPNLQMMNF